MVKRKGSKKAKKAHRVTENLSNENEDGVDDMDENGELDPEDLEYFQDSGRGFTFLQELASEVPSGGRKRKRKQVDEEEEEAGYEKMPRKGPTEQNQNERVLLPIKSKDSIIQRREKIPLTDSSLHSKETSSIEPGSETALQSGGSPTPPPTLSMVELFNQRRQKLMQRKFQIAELSSSILENPQENVSKLHELCKLCDEKDNDVRITTKKLAMVSLLTVFKDIIPGYPIRKTSEKEQGVKVRSGLIDVKPLQCSYSNGATWRKIDQSQR